MILDKEYDRNIIEIVRDIWLKDTIGIRNFFPYILWERYRKDMSLFGAREVFCITMLQFLEYVWITSLYTYQQKIIDNYTKKIDKYAEKQVISGEKLDKLVFFLQDFITSQSKNNEWKINEKELQIYSSRLFLNHFISFLQKNYLPS